MGRLHRDGPFLLIHLVCKIHFKKSSRLSRSCVTLKIMPPRGFRNEAEQCEAKWRNTGVGGKLDEYRATQGSGATTFSNAS